MASVASCVELENHARRHAGLQRLTPARGAEAPAVARLKSGEIEVWLRGGEVVASCLGEGKELRRDLDADCVQPEIVRARMAAAGAIEAGQRPLRATLQRLTEDVALGAALMASILLH